MQNGPASSAIAADEPFSSYNGVYADGSCSRNELQRAVARLFCGRSSIASSRRRERHEVPLEVAERRRDRPILNSARTFRMAHLILDDD
jgi:hypothetical protein